MKKRKRLDVSRRTFLKGAAAVAAAPTIIPASALGADGTTAPSERIVMAGLGIGNRGRHDLNRLMGFNDVQFVAIADPRRDNRERVAKLIENKYGKGCKQYIDFREMLPRQDIDAILMATGDRWHSLAATYAMKAGKDVYSEKPCSMSIAEGRMMADTARRYGRIYQAGTQRRSEANFVFIMELARTGKLGKLDTMIAHIMARMATHQWFDPQPLPPRDELDWDLYLGPTPWRPFNRRFLGWHWHVDMHGGGLPEWGSHTFDMCHWANDCDLSGPVKVEYPNNNTAEDMVMHYANGVKMICKGRGAFKGTCGIRLEGSEGWAKCSDGQPAVVEPESLQGEREKILKDYQERTGRALDHWRNFVDCVKSRQPTVAPPEVAHRSVSTSHIGNIAMWLKRDVEWDPEKEEFPNDEQANRMRRRPMRAPWHV
jgi:predicted dehydrogenase